MTNDYTQNFQYDSCTSRGQCSTNPKTASLQEILILYLKISAYYALKTLDYNINNRIRNLIIKTLSIMTSHSDFSEADFSELSNEYIKELPDMIKLYEENCRAENVEPELLKTDFKFARSRNIIKSIRRGEKEFLNKIKQIPQDVIDYYRTIFVIVKSISVNILDYKSYGKEIDDDYVELLKLLNSLNIEKLKKEDMINNLYGASKVNMALMEKIRAEQIKRYGEQRPKNVSYSTTPSRAVLVVGSNIRELEEILENLKESNIDVYTHDDMMLAHTFPLFDKYENLKGQYGQGIENCLLDFSTFPGPIILTTHSLYNVENLYRGRLYTTDTACSKGVIPIKNKDFTDVIKSANEMRGFKTGKQCLSETVGFNYKQVMQEIKNKIDSGNFSQIFILGSNGYYHCNKEYFKVLQNKTPKNVLLISFTPNDADYKNRIYINGCFDVYSFMKVTQRTVEISDVPITVFIPACVRDTISDIIFLSSLKNVNIYIGKCSPMLVSPSVISALKEKFRIYEISTVKNDLGKIIGDMYSPQD